MGTKQPIRDYKKLAQEILDTVGGEENIISVVHCATRLRLVLKHEDDQMKSKVASLAGVITVMLNGGQFQVVIGQHVTDVYDHFMNLIDLKTENQEQPKQSLLNRIIATMSAVFAPFVYILAAAGLLQGLLIVVKLIQPTFGQTGTFQVLNFISWAPFTFLPILIAITAATHFKTNVFIAVACCSALVSPDWTTIATKIAGGELVTFMSLPLTETVYTSSVLPPLLLVWALSYFERFLVKHVPAVLKELLVPFLALLIMVPLAFLVIGPISQGLADGVANGYNWLVQVAPALAGLIIGGFWEVLVIFGVHWGITPVVMANFSNHGMDSFQAFQTAAVVSQVGAVLGVFLKSKNKELKNVSLSAFITGLFGITEPTIYGVTLKYKRPFLFACLSGAVGAMIMSLFNSHYFVYAGLPGPLTIVNGISNKIPGSFMGIVIGSLVAMFGATALVYFFGTGEKELVSEGLNQGNVNELEQAVVVVPEHKMETIYSPVEGKVVELSEVDDPVFSSGAMGEGIAFDLLGNRVVAPFSGEIVMIAETKHAIGLMSKEGVQVLIHIGMDTVELKGKYFSVQVEVGQHVDKGEELVTLNRKAILEAGYSLLTPMLITNSAEYAQMTINPKKFKDIKEGQVIIEVQ